MSRKLITALLCFSVLGVSREASAGWLKKTVKAVTRPVVKVIKEVPKVALTVATAPIAVPVEAAKNAVDVIKGDKSVKAAVVDTVKAQVEPYTAVAVLGADTARAVGEIHHAGANVILDGAQKIGGDNLRMAAELATAPVRIQVAGATTSVGFVGDVATGEASLKEIVGLPVNILISSGHAQYERIAQQLPEHVKAKLRGHFPDDVLQSTRYAVGETDLSLASVLNGAERLSGSAPKGHAVTMDDIIVFSRAPGDSYHWWAHELQHVMQYRAWGLSEFSRRYTLHWVDVEADANAKADAVIEALAKEGAVAVRQ